MTTLDDRPATTPTDGPWWHRAACRGISWRLFFPDSRSFASLAIDHCRHCPVITQCRRDAVDQGKAYGVWAGQLWIDGKPCDPASPRPPKPMQAPKRHRLNHGEDVRRRALLLFHDIRHLHASNADTARAVGIRFGVSPKTVKHWVLADSRAQAP